MRLVTGLLSRAAGLFGGVPLLAWPLAAAVAWGAVGQWRAHSLRTEVAELRHAAAIAERDAAMADRDAAVRAEGQGRAAYAAAERYAAWAADQESRHAETSIRLRNALSAPIQACPGRVGDVLVPAAAVDGLRSAGADHAAGGARTTSAGPGR